MTVSKRTGTSSAALQCRVGEWLGLFTVIKLPKNHPFLSEELTRDPTRKRSNALTHELSTCHRTLAYMLTLPCSPALRLIFLGTCALLVGTRRTHSRKHLRWRPSNIMQPCNNWRRGFQFTTLVRGVSESLR